MTLRIIENCSDALEGYGSRCLCPRHQGIPKNTMVTWMLTRKKGGRWGHHHNFSNLYNKKWTVTLHR